MNHTHQNLYSASRMKRLLYIRMFWPAWIFMLEIFIPGCLTPIRLVK
jgi:hypothetical protein